MELISDMSGMSGMIAAVIVSLFLICSVYIFLKPREIVEVVSNSKQWKIEVFNRGKWRSAEECSSRGKQRVVHIYGQPDDAFHKRSKNNVRTA